MDSKHDDDNADGDQDDDERVDHPRTFFLQMFLGRSCCFLCVWRRSVGNILNFAPTKNQMEPRRSERPWMVRRSIRDIRGATGCVQ